LEEVAALREVLGIVSDVPDSEFSIEAFDISNISGTLAVSGMVAFTGGKPDKRRYRRFKIRNREAMAKGGDDFAMIAEAVSRRYGGDDPAPTPDLLLIDGGKGQLNAAIRALKAIGVKPLPVISLAKRNEEVFVPGWDEPLRLDVRSPALNLLRRVRDETHRFSVDYHRKLRDAAVERSELDSIPGVGPARKKALLKAFGSLEGVREASPEEIAAAVPGIGAETAARIASALAGK
jgi:excinuclease ABC subunit C